MRMNGFDIYCYRGESFTLDFDIVNNDGSPYILPAVQFSSASGNERLNYHEYYLLISIAPKRNNSYEKVVDRTWLSCNDIPIFKCTVPLEVRSFDEGWPPYRPDGTKYAEDLLEGVYYTNVNGVKTYKYYDENDAAYKDYRFRVIYKFTPEITVVWTEHEYEYSIRLISGEQKFLEDGYDAKKWADDVYIIPPSKLIVENEL